MSKGHKYECYACGKKHNPPRYYWWEVFGMEFCSEKCALKHSPVELIKDNI